MKYLMYLQLNFDLESSLDLQLALLGLLPTKIDMLLTNSLKKIFTAGSSSTASSIVVIRVLGVELLLRFLMSDFSSGQILIKKSSFSDCDNGFLASGALLFQRIRRS